MSYVEFANLQTATWAARCDPRVKLMWLGAVSLVAVLVDSTAALIALFAVTLLGATALVWSRRTWVVVAGILLAVAWGTMLSQAMFYPVEPRTPLVTFVPPVAMGPIRFPGLALYREGAIYGLVQSLRMTAAILAGLSVCLSTSPERLLAGLVSLRVPSAASFMTVAALRFLPTMVEQWSTVRRCRRLRGPRSPAAGRHQHWWPSWRTETALLIPVVAAALRRAGTLATSLTARGFDATGERTTYPPLAMNGIERGIVALLCAVAATLSALKSLYWLSEAGIWSLAGLEPVHALVRDWL